MIITTYCMLCEHRKGYASDYCKAFPDKEGIPIEMIKMEFKHTKPYPGDNGIVFEILTELKSHETEIRKFHGD